MSEHPKVKAVQAEAADALSEDPVTHMFDQALMSYEEKMVEVSCGRAILPNSLHQVESTAWDRRTGWLVHFRGKDIRLIANAGVLPVQSSTNTHDHRLLRLCDVVDKKFVRCLEGGRPENCPVHIRRVLGSRTKEDLMVEAA